MHWLSIDGVVKPVHHTFVIKTDSSFFPEKTKVVLVP